MRLNDESMYEQACHVMEFNEDFVQMLREYERLPLGSIDEQMHTLKDLKDYKERN